MNATVMMMSVLDYDAVACVSEIVALGQAKGHEAISQSQVLVHLKGKNEKDG